VLNYGLSPETVAVNSLNSLMAVFAPLYGASLLASVSHLPHSDWRIGSPFYFCAVLQAASLALAFFLFRSEHERLVTHSTPPELDTKKRPRKFEEYRPRFPT